MDFILKAEFIIEEKDRDLEKNIYNLEYGVKLLEKNDDKAVIYDKSSGMYFENLSGITYVYEIETKKVDLSLTKRLVKGQDIIRRLFFRYDWIQLYVNRKGKITAIPNSNDLKNVWTRLRKRILKDYMGIAVENFLDRLDNDYQKGDEPVRAVNHHLHFGLLFPNIPFDHYKDWDNRRTIRFSEYESERFEESIVYKKTEDNLRYYTISGNILPESKTILSRYEGMVCVPIDDIFPEKANLHAEYTQGIRRIEWNFTLERKKQTDTN